MKYRNITHFDVSILIGGERKVIKPNEEIELNEDINVSYLVPKEHGAKKKNKVKKVIDKKDLSIKK